MALLVGAVFMGCGDDPPAAASGGCRPACSLGYACVADECVPACNPACSPVQTCIVRNGTAVCEAPMTTPDGGDAAVAADQGLEMPEDLGLLDAVSEGVDDRAVPDDVTTADGALDSATTDIVIDAPDVTPDVATDATRDAVAEVAALDVVDAAVDARADVTAMDVVDVTVADAPADVAVDRAADVAVDVVADVVADVAADATRPPCGMAGQACCQNRVCVGASVCDTVMMRCVAFTPTPGECTASLTCGARETCGGFYLCGDRPCLLCVMPGTRVLGEACTTNDQCASAYCANSQCATPCQVGPIGAASCAALDARNVCAQFTSRMRVDAGTGTLSTFGACLRGCTRNGDCATTQVCRLQRNDYEDRQDQICGPPTGALLPGAACDPNPPSGATSAMFCNNSQCVETGAHTGYCAPFCATDADCPSTDYVCISFMFGRPSGTVQPIRACAHR